MEREVSSNTPRNVITDITLARRSSRGFGDWSRVPPSPRSETDPEAVRRLDTRTRSLADQVAQLANWMNRLHVGTLAFGLLPASRRLHAAYVEISTAFRHALIETSGTLVDTGSALDATAEQYEQTERANAASFRVEGGA